ncbi:hypothetical protein MNBD_GAMMA09-2594 [hydrothermal vent metagenome]|uniref:Uncharacterized protein n=1 Tax=hydrothermal vent metagenome TaxID=652676 RepID=A0A3B0YDW1_9ZZZZ
MKNSKNKAVNITRPTSFWVLSGLFLIWNLLGVFHYLTSVNATVESLVAQGMTIKQAEVFHNTPSYHYAVFALGVWSGLLGAALLLLRKAWAAPVFLFSAVMVIVSFVLDAVSGNLSALGLSYLGIMTFTLMLALFEAWYSKRMKVHGILQ